MHHRFSIRVTLSLLVAVLLMFLTSVEVGAKTSNKSAPKSAKSPASSKAAKTTAARATPLLLAQNDLEDDLESELELEGSEESVSDAELDEDIVPQGEEVEITDIQYDGRRGNGLVIVKTSGAATYRTRNIPEQSQVVLEIANAKLPDKLKRPYNTKDFRQAVVSVNAYQDAGSSTARIVIQFRQPREVTVNQNGKLLTVSPGNERGDVAIIDPDDDEAAGDFASAKAAANSGKILPSSTLEESELGEPRYYGKPISIEVRETPIRDVINLIAEQAGANIIIASEVQGAISLRLRQVPWDQALAIVMRAQNLGYVRQGGVLRIAPLTVLRQEAETARLILEAQRSTEPLQVKLIPLSFARAGDLAAQIRETLQAVQQGAGGAGAQAAQGGRGRIATDQRSNTLIVTDTAENIARIEKMVKALDSPPLQVMIEGKIIEAVETFSNAFGINWGYSGQDLGVLGGTLSHGAQISPTLGGANTTVNLQLGTIDFLGDLNATLTLLERSSQVRIISSPRVVTLNNQQASISQTVNIAIQQTAQANGVTTTSTVFQPVPLQLSVTPQITAGGDVIMQINFSRSFLAASAGATPNINQRQVQTNVMVRNGQTSVIGGIYQADNLEQEDGTPFLRRFPILGWLFKTKNSESVKNELLVFLTPRILNADKNLPRAGGNNL
ncbi:MAG TPA: type IV pilus secretin PilQ [Pseudobdellovibrionaceae bacterium]|nr:type IV pilus secretin PilQ [Pseudobdellovibrionaceae bacterium]